MSQRTIEYASGGSDEPALEPITPVVDTLLWRSSTLGSKPIPITVVADRESSLDPATADALIHFSGFGERIDSAGVAAVRTYGALGLRHVVVVDLPFWLISPDQLPHMLAEAPNAVAEQLGAPRRIIDSFGQSRGGIFPIGAAEAPELWRGVIGMGNPAGVTNDQLGRTALARTFRLAWQLGAQNSLQWPPDLGIGRVGTRAIAELARYRQNLLASLNYAMGPELSTQLGKALQTLHPDHMLALFANTRDPLYRLAHYHEFARRYELNGLVHPVEGHFHPGALVRAGRAQQASFVMWLSDVRAQRDSFSHL
ncbi:MAG TPA: hypothetical protein VLF91_00020 [Candidatus Saccharimonadales bacterium]|nr:hypothetical protein [Candidatus Saccharimonadales bacterium]